MKINLRPVIDFFYKRRYAYIEKVDKWRKTFAFLPCKVADYQWVWLQYCERRRGYFEVWWLTPWEYRFIRKAGDK